MGAKKDKKQKSKKGKANVKGGNVNQPEEIPEHSDIEVQEGDQEKSQKKGEKQREDQWATARRRGWWRGGGTTSKH